MWKLDINENEQTIQGVKIADRHTFQQIQFSIINEVLEGWQPTAKDIQNSIHAVTHPDGDTVAAYRQVFGENDGE